MQLRTFTQVCRNIIRMYANQIDQVLFRPARDGTKRLEQYGITNHVPCISAEMCLSTEAAYKLHEHLARVINNLNKNK